MDQPTLNPAEVRFRGWKIIIPLFLLPLVIVLGSVGVFYLFGRLAQNQKTPDEYLSEMMHTTGHQRWQSALELSRSVILQKPETLDPAFEEKLIEIFRHSKAPETELRMYLTVALANIGREKSAELFAQTLEQATDPQEKIYALWALGKIKKPLSAPTIRRYLSSEDAGLRKTAAFALGFTGDATDLPSLEALLADDTNDVRWNAALALANLGSSRGEKEIRSMLDAKTLEQATPLLRADERNEIAISALNAALKIRLQGVSKEIDALKESPDSRVRTLAQKVSDALNES